MTPLDFFIRATDALVKFEANFTSILDEDLDVYSLEIQGAEAKELWVKVKDFFEKCLNDIQSSDTSSAEELTSVESKYDVAFKAYVKVLSAINRKVDQLRTMPKAQTSPRVVNSSSTPRANLSQFEETISVSGVSHQSANLPDVSTGSMNDSFLHCINLPPCDIDVFGGDILTWPTFRDFFSAVYINNSRLRDIEKLCHLLKKTKGDAREIVKRFTLTHKS